MDGGENTDSKFSESAPSSRGSALSPLDLDGFPKVTALFVATAYIAGYFIFSIHFARFGFSEQNPFKPRIFGAGATFLFLSSLPVSSVYAVERLNLEHVPANIRGFIQFFFLFIGAHLPAILPAMFSVSGMDAGAELSRFHLWIISKDQSYFLPSLIICLGSFIVVLAISSIRGACLLLQRVDTWKTQWISALLVLITIATSLADAGIAYYLLPYHVPPYRSSYLRVLLWSLLLTIVCYVVWKIRNKHKENLSLLGNLRIVLLLPVISTFLWIYSYLVFSVIPYAAWGGGHVSVIIHVKNVLDDPIYRQIGNDTANLLDERDDGLYISLNRTDKAIFLPKDKIEFLDFCVPLKDNKKTERDEKTIIERDKTSANCPRIKND